MSNDNADIGKGGGRGPGGDGEHVRAPLTPNPRRAELRAALRTLRNRDYELRQQKRKSGLFPSEEKERRSLRQQQRRLTAELRDVPPFVTANGETLWSPQHFARFRHSGRATRWVKAGGRWRLRLPDTAPCIPNQTVLRT